MNTFIYWSDKPFNPRRSPSQIRRRTRYVTIRYRGSLGRSAVKAFVVLLFLAIMSNVMGGRTSQNRDANEVATKAGSAGIHP